MTTDSEFLPETDSNSTLTCNTLLQIYCDTISEITLDNISEITVDTDIESEYYSDDFDDDDTISITEDEIMDLTSTSYDMISQYLKENILLLSSEKFYINMIMYITEILYTDITINHDDDCVELDNTVFEELKEFVEQTVHVFLDISEIPRRSQVEYINRTLSRVTRNEMNLKITELQNIIQPEQKTQEWYKFRYNLITASNLWKVFGTNSQVNSLIYEKCKPLDLNQSIQYNTCTEGPLHWGVKYEPVTVQLYEQIYNTKIGEFGCIPHPTYPYIGASPDGINIDSESNKYGRMLEIKNIVNREITGIPKQEYWIQTQIQMETCDLDECDFVETRFKEYDKEEQFYLDQSREYRGIILHFIERPPLLINEETKLSNIPYYVYMPLNIPITQDTISDWINTQKLDKYKEHKVLFAVKYWYLDEISCVLIPRNRLWFNTAVSKIKDTWNIILKERTDGYEHRASKKRQNNNNTTMSIISDDGIQMTVFSKVENPVCFIKLDQDGNVL
uniref:YqaJ viral recombinase domain-containing protein n=1 Tax=viral metagenome TaxID=1070528 RepID=A0A6C0J351_9ZZZZ